MAQIPKFQIPNSVLPCWRVSEITHSVLRFIRACRRVLHLIVGCLWYCCSSVAEGGRPCPPPCDPWNLIPLTAAVHPLPCGMYERP